MLVSSSFFFRVSGCAVNHDLTSCDANLSTFAPALPHSANIKDSNFALIISPHVHSTQNNKFS